MNKDKSIKTHVALVVDKSYSMLATAPSVISNFNEQITALQRKSREGHDIRCSIVSFNDEVDENFWNVKADDVTELTSEDYKPIGGTAMFDALGHTLTKLRKIASEDKEVAFLIVVLSDGQTNSDSHYDANTVRPLVESCEEDKRYTITYIGCDKSYLRQVAAATGLNASNMATADMSARGFTSTVGSNSLRSMGRYFDERELGLTASLSYCSTTGDMADWSETDPAKAEAVLTGQTVNSGLVGKAPVNVQWKGVDIGTEDPEPPKKK